MNPKIIYEEQLRTSYLTVVDYVIFVVVLVISAGIGIIFALTGGKQKTVGEYLMANRQMGLIPVTLSLLASFLSAMTLLGTPTEIYIHGAQYMLSAISYVFVMMFAAHVFLPVFYHLQLTSTYEYLEIRFHPLCRAAGTTTFVIQMVIYMGLVLYAPSLALNAVTGLPWWACVLSLGAVVTFYTTVGGMKAVMWTDVFQFLIMLAGMSAILIQTGITFGGFTTITDAMRRGGRLDIWNFDPNPTVRTSFWSIVIGPAFTWLSIYGTNQAMVQRYLCSRSLREAQLAIWLNFFGLVALMILCALCGFCCYAFYEGCDPLMLGRISKGDQILPLYVMDTMSHLPGFAGLFIATIFSGALRFNLSTVSSGVNSLAAVCFEDIYRPIQKYIYSRKIQPSSMETEKNHDNLNSNVSKIIALGFAILAIAVAFLASKMGDLLQAGFALFGMLGGPLLGVFFMGMTMPFINWQGALIGHIVGLILSMWVGFGSLIFKYSGPRPPLSIVNCTIANITTIDYNAILFNSTFNSTLSNAVQRHTESYAGLNLYKMSFLWRGAFAFGNVVIVGIVVSAITGFQKNESLKPELLSPVVRRIYMKMPLSLRKYNNIEKYETANNKKTSNKSEAQTKSTSF